MKRVFLAIPVGDDLLVRTPYEEIRASLRGEKIKWVRPENLHLTLHFFGELEEEAVMRADQLFRSHLAGLGAFDMELRGAGVFPGLRKPRVLWLGITVVKELEDLVATVEEVLLEGDFELPDKPFSAHLTLGRIKWIDDRENFTRVVEDHCDRKIARLPVREVHLMESILRPEGPEYKVIQRYMLRNDE
jgi:2'-5' RNA ligase